MSSFIKIKKFNMTQHGFARDKEFELIENKMIFIEFRLCNDEKTLEIYPFSFELYLSYKLEKMVFYDYLSFKVVNKSDDKCFFKLVTHPVHLIGL